MALGSVTVVSATLAGTMAGSYVTNDVVGTLTTLTSALSANGGSGVIEKVIVWDDTDTLIAFDLFVASASVTQAADSAQFAPSDADNKLYVAQLQFPTPLDVGGARQVMWSGAESVYNSASGTSLFVTMVMRGTLAGAITTSALTSKWWIRQDQ